MKIAIHIKKTNDIELPPIQKVLNEFENRKVEILLNVNFKLLALKHNCQRYFSNSEELISFRPDFLISIGGDGTLLDTLLLVRDSEIPVIGLNLGRLGFLSNNPIENPELILDSINKGEYEIDKRTVIELSSNKEVFPNENYALNDFTIHKTDNSTLTTISTYINNEFFNTYWADGIITSTPTGSTAYSLSCGGPIVHPESKSFILTPVAPHNLNVRPVVLSENDELSFEIKGREKNILVSLDSRYMILDQSYKLKVSKASFKMYTVRFKWQNFTSIIREKLMWGIDNRNF